MAREKAEKKEEMAEEASAAGETTAVAASDSTEPAAEVTEEKAVEETFEQRQARQAREDYERRNLEAIKEREEIFRREGLLKEGESLNMDPQAALDAQCC